MFNKLQTAAAATATPRHLSLIGSAIAAIILTALVLVPTIGTSVAAGLFLTPGVGGLLYTAPPLLFGLTALLFASFIVIVFYLLRIKHSMFIAALSLPVGYVLLTALNKIIDIPFYQKAALFGMIAFVLVYSAILVSRRLHITTIISAILFILLVGVSVYSAQLIEQAINRHQRPVAQKTYEQTQQQAFETARRNIKFTTYYPTAISAALPVSLPELNGFSQDINSHVNPHVTYTLGGALVTQAGLVKNQEKLMDFTRNCDILRLTSSMVSDSAVGQSVIDSSLKNLSRCKVIYETPAGVKVYTIGRGDFATLYIQLNETNIVIKFDGSRRHKYSDTLLPEITKMIDSFQPLSTDKLQRGSERRADI